MFHPRAKCLLVVLLFITGMQVAAQTTTSSGANSSNPNNGRENNPYSKYGIGELTNGNSATLRGMGNVTSAFENPYELNTDNPASYSFIRSTTFEIGATASTRNIAAPGLSYTTGTASLSYFSLGFPVNKNAGFCFGFKPVSHVYYALADTIPNGNTPSPIGQVARSYNGEGSLNYAFLGGAWRYKGLSIGANVGYMFGTIQNTTAAVPIDSLPTNRAFTSEYSNYNQIGGLYWKLGLMYERRLDSDYTIRFGGTFSLKQNLTDRFTGLQISGYNFTDTIVNDTVSNTGEKHGKLTMPTSLSIGVMLAKNDKWGIAADFSASQWSDYHSTVDSTLNSGIAKQSYKLSLGGEITPDVNNTRNYFARVTYRAGVYYGQDYLKIGNAQLSGNGEATQLPVYGVTLGASLPVRRSLSHLHVALDLGRIGTTANNLLQETYFRFTLGVSFNDNRWFIKRRYD